MPIVMPSNYDEYSIIGIDPSVNNLGISIYRIDYITNTIKSIEALTFKSDKLFDNSGLDNETCSERNIKIYKIRSHFEHILKVLNPRLVICESPFYNPSMPNAYASLVQIIQSMHFTCLDYNSNIYFITIEPLLVKKTIGAGMTKGKIDVKDSIIKNNLIMSKLLNDINLLDEHSIDAIAISYSYLKLNNIVNLQ